MLVVSFDQSILSATRISALYSFTSVLTGTILGLVVVKVRRLKPFIIFGTCMWLVAFGLLIRYRGYESSRAGIIAGQVLLGFGGGFFTYPVQTSIQSCTRHEHLAVVTGLYLSMYNIGSALGGTISGIIYTQTLPGQLAARLPSALATTAYATPYTFIATYPVGTPQRTAVIQAYQYTQKLLCITGICLVVPLVVFALFLRDNRLTDEQSLPDAEGMRSESSLGSDGDDFHAEDAAVQAPGESKGVLRRFVK